MNATQTKLMNQAKANNGRVSVVYASRGLKGGKSTFGLREKAAGLKLVEQGLMKVEAIPGNGGGVIQFVIV